MTRSVKPRTAAESCQHLTRQLADEVSSAVTDDDLRHSDSYKQSNSALHTDFAVKDFNIYTAGQRVQLSTMQRQYL